MGATSIPPGDLGGHGPPFYAGLKKMNQEGKTEQKVNTRPAATRKYYKAMLCWRRRRRRWRRRTIHNRNKMAAEESQERERKETLDPQVETAAAGEK